MSETAGFTITKTFDATPEELYEAWTDAKQYGAWSAAEPWSLGELTMDVTVGGQYLIETLAPETRDCYTHFGEYLALEPNKLIEMTWGMRGPDGGVIEPRTLCTISLSQLASGATAMTMTCTDVQSEERAEMYRQGWEVSGLVDLEKFLASRA